MQALREILLTWKELGRNSRRELYKEGIVLILRKRVWMTSNENVKFRCYHNGVGAGCHSVNFK